MMYWTLDPVSDAENYYSELERENRGTTLLREYEALSERERERNEKAERGDEE